jgi:hypothetical protein
MDAALSTVVDSDFQSRADAAIVLDDDSATIPETTEIEALRNDMNERDDTHATTPSGERDRPISLSDNSQQARVDVLPTNEFGRQETTGGSTTEPMPDFGAMTSAELKRRVKQFGLKVSGKKVMVRQLAEIWVAQNRLHDDSTAIASAIGNTALVRSSTEQTNAGQGASSMSDQPLSSSDTRAQSKLSREQTLSRQVRAFVLSQPRWYTTVLLLNAIDMRALHVALNNAASLDSSMIKCSLKQLETILREQGISFQAQS